MYKDVIDPKTPWTDEQKLAIGLSGGKILVSASAGSGKTAVLTERIMQRITDADDPADVRDFVVVTFTKAAAAEMKARLGKKLSDYARENPGNKHVKKQLMYIPEANISTIDAYCLALLEKYQAAEGADYSAGVRISAEGEADLLFKKALADAVEAGFGSGDREFYALVDAMEDSGGGTSDLKSAVCRLHDLMGRTPDREEFKRTLFASFGDDYRTRAASVFERVFADLELGVKHWTNRLLDLEANAPDCAGDAALENKLAKQFKTIKSYKKNLASLAEAIEARDYDGTADLLREKLESKADKRGIPAEWIEARDFVIDGCKEFRDSSAASFSHTEEEMRADADALEVIVRKLVELEEQAELGYAKLKKDRGVWDYTDLEMKALALLWKRGDDGKPCRTAVSLEEGGSHKEILIDEYQDVNKLQELLFRGICSEAEDNIFMVGDVKQAIYGFRGATPEIFMDHRRDFAPAAIEDCDFPAKISLNNNFRSRRSVTDAVNAVFGAVMTEETCGINYGAEDLLRPDPAMDRENYGSGAYFTLLRGDKVEDGRLAEGRYIAAKIKEIIEGGMTVVDKREKTERKVGYSDFVVLMRGTTQPHLRPITDAFTEAGIPFSAPGTDSCLDVPSVRRMISLLRAVDNPMKNIDLAAAMTSGVFRFTESELVRIRGYGAGVLYYAVKAAAEDGDSNCADFIGKLERLRRKAAALTADKLIWYIYKTSGFLAFVSSLESGRRERPALVRFYEIAKAYGASGRQDLSGFVSYIDKVISEGVKTSGVGTPGVGGEVRIMSIHAAKGLEFPVCFICDAAAGFNEDDLKKSCIIGDSKAFGVKIAVPGKHTVRDTASRKLAAAKLRKKGREEEMRLLYVAMTRAIERVEIVASVNDTGKTVRESGLKLDAAGRMDAYDVTRANSFMKLVAPIALAGMGGFTASVEPEFDVSSPEEEGSPAPAADPALADRIYKRINSTYPHSDSVAVPTKLTVSEIVAMRSGDDDDNCCERMPACLNEGMRGGAEAGTATHAFLQFADFDKLDDPEAEIERLVSQRFITAKQAKLIDRRKLANFVSSDIFRRIRASGDVTREFRFTFEADASDFIPDAPKEKLLVQGAIDCVFEEDGKCVVVDYKTDRIKDDLAEKAAHYKPQLEIYARGLRELTGREVSEAILYFLDAGEAVRVI